MKIFNKITLLLITIFFIISQDAIATGSPAAFSPTTGLHTPHGGSAGRKDAFKPANFRYTWKLDVKLASLKNVGMLGDNGQPSRFDFIRDAFHSLKDLPSSVYRVYMYGNGKAKNTTMLIFGNVDSAWLEDYVVAHLNNNNHRQFKHSKKNLSSRLQDITRLTIQSNDEKAQRVVYYSEVRPGLYVTGSNITEIKRWKDYPRSVMYWDWPNTSTLLSLQMLLEPTLKNLKSEGVIDNYMLKSKIFKDSKDINVSINESEEKIFIGASITTKKSSQIEELKQVLTDLFSSSDYKTNDNINNQLLENLEIINKNNVLKIGTIIPKAAFDKVVTNK